MTPQELKNSILQLAIQGKLVEQCPEEGTAEELYKSIVFNGNQANHDEIIDEVPFDIPPSWMWVRHNSLFEIVGGSQPPKERFIDSPKEGFVRLYQIRDYGDKPVPVYVPIDTVSKFSHKGDILLARYGGSLGKIFWAEEGAYNVAMAKVVHLYSGNPIDDNYLFYYYCAPLYQTLVKGNTRSAQAGFNKEDLGNLLFPLPPLAEQKRIVAKIEELLPLIERYEKAWSRLEDFNKRFPGDMQKSLLQMAIQGKLVEQRPEEGTGEELYQQIQREKQTLIKAGKIKKEKPLPEITEDEIPFDIPESWKWIRLGILTELITSGSRDWAQFYSESGDIFLRMGNLSRNSLQLRLDKIQYVSLPEKAEGQRTALQEGDLLFSITGEVGTLGLIPPNFGKAYINQHTAMIRFILSERNLYIPYLLLTDYAQKYYNGNQHGIKNSFRLDSISLMAVPLPPLAEQKRIVARLEGLLLLCERLK